uniref:Uncharacterized protein n=1 Tax=Pithovirus LCPAC202 TaxID=2506592 RepID=A0A481Z666_9VIRU|nr:MAG: hypothetical protein LCPAC202_00190 [Pithovirus LCPAC202]
MYILFKKLPVNQAVLKFLVKSKLKMFEIYDLKIIIHPLKLPK